MELLERKDYKPTNIEGTFDDKYIKHKSEGNEEPTITEYLENRPYLHDMIDNLKKLSK